MNILIIIAFVLGGGTIIFDRRIRALPHWLAVVLYTAAVALFVIGMIMSRGRNA